LKERKLNRSTLLLGIDIGWSEKQRSCAFAAHDPKQKIIWPVRAQKYGNNEAACCRFKLSELIGFLASVRDAMAHYDQTVVVVDGPLGPHSRPTENRPVDSSFRCDEFRNRMQPSDIKSEVGQTYVRATYQVAECLAIPITPWVEGPVDSSFVIAETNPTVGLALINRKYAVNKIPSRKRPLVPPSSKPDERAIRAKSDFYWRIGANMVCGDILRSTSVAAERNHENVAGLYCLAVASALSAGNAISFGDKQAGVYVFPNTINVDWHADLAKVGIVSGSVQSLQTRAQDIDFDSWCPTVVLPKKSTEAPITLEASNDQFNEDLSIDDNNEILLLCDNGSVWQQHNDWLEGVSGPVTLQCLATGEAIELVRARGAGQWTANPTTLSIAKLNAFDRGHLSREHCVAIEVGILEMSL
jgi:hypothetical protein